MSGAPLLLAPPRVDEVAALERRLAADPGGAVPLLAEDPGHPSIPWAVRSDWARRIFPGRGIERVFLRQAPEILARTPGDRVFRRELLARWEELHPVARPDFVVRVALIGAESVGKSVLTERLAERLGGVAVPEYGRDAFPWADPGYEARPEHLEKIAYAHRTSVEQAAGRAVRYLISDTEAVTTEVWSEFYLGAVPAGVRRAVATQRFDLVLYLEADVPWVDDGVRSWQSDRARFAERLLERAEEEPTPVVRIGGDWAAREEASIEAIRALGAPRGPLGLPGRWGRSL